MSESARAVLLVEDDQDIRNSILEVLASEGIPAEWAAEGDQALAQLRAARRKPSLILLDLRLPGRDGISFRQVQAADPDLSHIPVVVISADGRLQEKTSSLGISGVLRKPVDIDELLRTVKQHLCAESLA